MILNQTTRVVCVFQMVVASTYRILPLAEFGPNDHQEHGVFNAHPNLQVAATRPVPRIIQPSQIKISFWNTYRILTTLEIAFENVPNWTTNRI